MYKPKHFSASTEFMMGEQNVFQFMDATFLKKLDQLRDLVREPLTLNSTYRSPAYNEAIGGSKGSKHMEGIAADISCKDSKLRHKIVMEAASLGLTVGVAKTFVHIDNRKTGRFPILFLY